MTEHDPIERELRTALAVERAPVALQRRIAQIPLEHPRRPVAGRSPGLGWLQFARSWFSAEAASWTTGLAGAAASLVIGLWLGFAGVGVDNGDGDDDLVALVYSDLPTSIGDEL